MEEEIQKRYYSISEVAEMFGVKASHLRFWETEFPQLKPKKNKKGDRQYTQKDIDILKHIFELTRDKGYTLTGAKESMKQQTQQQAQKAEMIKSLEQIKALLTLIRDNLEEK